ncbi:MAG: hypothetical protein ACYSVY_22975 [Planctomycetota bacterium]
MRSISSSGLPWTALAAATFLAAGCSGSAHLYVIPAEHKRIDMRGPLVVRYDVPHCYYWVNQRQELCAAFSYENVAPEGTARRRSFDLSLVLGPLPAGRARNYAVDRRTMRAILHEGAEHRRFASLYGIVGVWFDERHRVLRGRFSIWANQQDYKVWRDWAGDRRVILRGEFTALPDGGRGTESLDRTEVGALKRPPPANRPRRVYGPAIEVQPAQP